MNERIEALIKWLSDERDASANTSAKLAIVIAEELDEGFLLGCRCMSAFALCRRRNRKRVYL